VKPSADHPSNGLDVPALVDLAFPDDDGSDSASREEFV